MSVFDYPKTQHARVFKPRQFKNYRTYKPYLKREFVRVCVYCRQPDSSAPNLNFGVDHYRPKGIPRFAKLVCAYSNLYYCCGLCNSRKNDDWPLDEVSGARFVNPCDHVMFAHLRFDAATGKMEPKSPNGRHMEALLQLNEPASVQYRKNTLNIIRKCDVAIATLKGDLQELKKRLIAGRLSQADFDVEAADINAELLEEQALRDSVSGEEPLPPLTKTMQRLLATA